MLGGGRTTCAAVVVAGMVAAIAPAATPAQQPQSAGASSLEAALLADVNVLRARRGLARLRRSGELTRAAAAHARAMGAKGFFRHQSADGSAFWKRIQRHYSSAGHTTWGVGENLLWASPTIGSEEAVQRWLNSPKHRRVLLDPIWRDVGIAAVHLEAAPGVFGGLDVTILTANFGFRQ